VVDCNWTNADLEIIKGKFCAPSFMRFNRLASSGGKAIVESWNRQRSMGLDVAIDALGNHPLKYYLFQYLRLLMIRNDILNEFNKLKVILPSTVGYNNIPVPQLPNFFKIGKQVQIGFSAKDGSVNYLTINNISICHSQVFSVFFFLFGSPYSAESNNVARIYHLRRQ
jgi:hypothetical protein